MRLPLLARTWDRIVGCKTARTPALRPRPVGLALLPLEDRITPTGRPLPLPFLFVGAGSGAPPRVRAYDAETGDLKFERQPFDAAFTGGVRVAAGDINRDGLPDLVAAAGPGGGPAVTVYDGLTGNRLAGPLGGFFAYDPGFTGGVSAASGDVDGDGWHDIVTAAGAGGAPVVRVFSGRTAQMIRQFDAFDSAFRGGATVVAADFTGDGKADLAVGAGAGGGPNVRVFDLNTGGPLPPPLGSFFAFDESFEGGVEVGTDALAGDVSGDSVPDIVVGRGPGAGSLVRVFDGKTGAPVREFSPFGAGVTAGVRVSAAFVDDDEFADVVVGTGEGVSAQVRVFSGLTSAELASPMSPYAPFGPAFTGGVFVAASNDPPLVSIAVTASPGTVAGGGTVTFTATVSDAKSSDGVQTPAGTVAFAATATVTSPPTTALGTATLSATGGGTAQAVLVVSSLALAADSYLIDATYSGDGWFAGGAVLGGASLTVTAALPEPGLRYGPPEGVCPPGGVRDDGLVGVSLFDGLDGGVASSVAAGPSGALRFTNGGGYADGAAKRGGGVVADEPRLTRQFGGNKIARIDGAGSSLWFDAAGGGTYTTPFGRFDALVQNSGTGELELTDGSGVTQYFYDFGVGTPSGRAGRLKRRVDAAGNTAEVVAWDSDGRATEWQMTDAATGAVESLVSAYDTDDLLTSITRRRKLGAGSWATVRSAEFTYATVTGAAEKALVSTVRKDAGGTTLEETYNRYYASGSGDGYAGGLRYALGAKATARLKAAYPGTALSALTDAQVAEYTDWAFEYDPANRRATQVVAAGAGCSVCSGGQGTSNVTTAVNTRTSPGVNDWTAKVTETLDDGTVRTRYANQYGQTLLSAVSDGTNTWLSYTKYDADGRVILQANPSAVSGFSESLDDLVGWSGSSATYLNSSSGLIATTTYATSTTATSSTAGDAAGYVASTWIQRGTGGTPVKQSATTYIARTANGQTRYHVAASTHYRNDNGTGGQTTSYAYTWQGSTAEVASVTTTLPTVTTGQNGPNSAASSVTVFDALGRPIWSKDAAGVLAYTAYDAQTGAVVKSIADVNVANTGDFTALPSGWTTPSGAGQHLIATYEVDALGRTTKSTDPLGRVSYTVYNDVAKEVRAYAGWDSGTNAPTGPTSVSRDDWAGGYSESLTMSATPSVSSGRPTGAESISGIQSLSRSYRNAAGQTTHSDNYFDLTGVTYSTAANIGTLNTHRYRTESAYDKQGRQNKVVSAAGTITRTEYDALGRAVSTWVGTDDTPTTGFWSTTNLTGTNMVKVSEVEYDGGGVGDGNATKTTQFPGGGAAARVSQTWYDWRNRAVASKSGVESSESTSVNRPISYTQYDNLGEAVASEMYDGDAVTVTSTAGVPNRPSSSLLRAKTVSTYDDLGRAYKTETYSVDPSSGSVSSYALTSQVWFDLRGLTLKTSSPGGLVQKTAYDSLGRATTTYVTDGGGDSGWSDADDVTGDTVLSQSEMTYDAGGNVLLSVSRERMHDASGTGALGTPSSGVTARVSYAGFYYDLLGRTTATVNVGTNGGSSWTRPGSVPSRSDTVLVNSVEYDAAGNAWKTTDPKGIESRTSFDLLGRTTKTIQNYVDGTVSDVDDKTVEYEYGAAGMTRLKAKLTGGGEQVTEYVYGVTQGGGSGVDSNDIVGATKWPDPSTGASSSGQQETTTVNALGQTLTATDRNGNVHTLTYDVLGRVISDAVTTLGSGVDGTVRRVETAYDSQGNAYLVTTYDAASGGSIVTQVQRQFDGLGNLTREGQSHSGAVNTSTTPSVQYAYSTLDSANRVRHTSMTYPSGYVLTYNYASGLNSNISRLSSLSDASGTVESYDYLGLGTVVRRSHPLPGVDLTFIGTGTADAGDQYVGLDRFGRVVLQKWVKTSTSTVLDEATYTYDRNGNRTAEGNGVNSAFDETYGYDSLNQLTSFARGSHTQAFDYDAVGNRDSVTTDGGSPQTYGANKQNEITSISGATTPTYDANGNMTTDETGRQFVYDAWNRLVIVKNSGGTTLKTYTVDGLGRRVAETASGTTTDLYYSSQWQVLEEAVSGSTTKRYVWSPVYVDAMILRDRDTDANGSLDERLWVIQDANFNVTALVNSGGSVVERYAYDPYGVATVMNASWTTLGGSAYSWQHLHQGGRLDGVSGLHHFRNRDYSATLGRWVSMDPIRYYAGDVNLYGYIANSPYVYTDALGYSGSKGGGKANGKLANIVADLTATTKERFWLCILSSQPPKDPEGVLEATRGHAWIAIIDTKTGATLARGLYPSNADLDSRNPECPGEVRDDSATLYAVARCFAITEKEFKQWEQFLNQQTRNPPNYQMHRNNCTSWAVTNVATSVAGVRDCPRQDINVGNLDIDIQDNKVYNPSHLAKYLSDNRCGHKATWCYTDVKK